MRVAVHLREAVARPGAARGAIVLGCVAALLLALAIRYPQSFADANRAARENASLDYLDRELGGGNSVLPEQGIAVEARGWIPADGSFTVAVGPHRPEWPALTTEATVGTYMRYFLLPRRSSPDARWVICLGCDRAGYPGARAVWEDADQGLAVLRRPA